MNPIIRRPVKGDTWVIDVDGVLWLAGEAIPGSAAAVSILREFGVRTVFATNNSVLTVDELRERLFRIGVECPREDVVTSAQAAANLVGVGATALVVAGAGVVEALEARSVRVLRVPQLSGRGERLEPGSREHVDVVVVGWSREFDYEALRTAVGALRAGAKLIATNDDPTYPTPGGLIPGAGSILAAVTTASGAVAEIAGKPHSPIARLIEDRYSGIKVVVGDRASTDGELARRLGVPFALVLSGVTSEAGAREGTLEGTMDVSVTAADLYSLVETFRSS